MTERKLTLEWVEEKDGCRALVFDVATWAVADSIRQALSDAMLAAKLESGPANLSSASRRWFGSSTRRL